MMTWIQLGLPCKSGKVNYTTKYFSNLSNFSIPDFLDEDMIIQGEGGVIYVDYDDLVTAESTVVEDDELVEDVTDEEIEDVMEHNNKLVGIIKNTMEMQAFLFDKLLNYLF